jgi:Pyridine nucleotide-disulphide oxidoreductase
VYHIKIGQNQEIDCMSASADCQVTIIGAGPYGLSAAAYLRAHRIEARVFGEPMSFWEHQMPKGMCLRSNWGASHIADPARKLTLDSYCLENDNPCPRPIPLSRFIDYGHWFQRHAVPDLDRRVIRNLESDARGFRITLADGETFTATRVVVAAGIRAFASRPLEFNDISPTWASHSSEHSDLGIFRGRRVAVIGAGQSALESAALLNEAGADVVVLARRTHLTWVGVHPRLHHMGPVSRILYSKRDVGPAGISRLVAAPHLFRRFPRWFKDPVAYRAIRPAVAGWLSPRLKNIQIAFGRRVEAVAVRASQLCLKLDDGSERQVDHALLATGFRVDASRYPFLSPELIRSLRTANGYPILRRGLESSVPGLHFLGKPASWSFGPLLGFVSGAEFAANELARCIEKQDGNTGK